MAQQSEEGTALAAGHGSSPDVIAATLLTRIGAGDHHAFSLLYVAAGPRVLRTVSRVLRNEALAVEATQECFIDIWRHAHTYDPLRGSAMAWILTIARRRAVDAVRSVEAGKRRDTAYAVDDYAPPENPEGLALDGLDVDSMKMALGDLTSRQREVIELVYFKGMKLRESADALGVPIGTAKTRLRDGIIRLRALMLSDV